jgi:translation initiation factor 3 subunit C
MQMSHIQDAINELDISTRILYNRTLVQLGLAAFRRGEFRSTLNTIADLYSVPQRIKELLAQGVVTKPDSREEDIADAKRRIYPYHMHINMDLIDSVHLISALLVEIPNIAEVGQSRRIISRPFRKHYQYFLQNLVNASQVDTPRDVIMSAAKALYDGDWKKSYDFLVSLKMWSYIRQADNVKAVMLVRIKREALRSFLLVNGSHYTSISMDVLKNMFDLPDHVIMQITNKMLHTDLISGAWDDKVSPPCIVITTTANNTLQKASLQFLDRLQQFSDHMNIPAQQRAAARVDDASQNKQKGGDRRSTNKGFATTRDRRARN